MSNDISKTQKKATSTTFHLIAGLGSGFTSSILLQPADLLKTRLQQSGTTTLLATLRQIRSQPNPIRQLWRGTLPSVIRTSVGSALYFTTLNAFRTSLAKRDLGVKNSSSASTITTPIRARTSSSLPQLTFLANLSSGAVARASVGFIMMPITVIKVRYESNYYAYTSLRSAATDIAKREGIRGFFAGFGATAIRDAPYAGLYVVFYEWGKRTLSAFATSTTAIPLQLPTRELAAAGPTPSSITTTTTPLPPPVAATISPTLSSTINFTSATLAASCSTALTNPPDAIKTRLQLQPQKYKNTIQALKLMLAEEGVRSLFDGLALRMARKAMSSALAWTVYEEVVRRAEVRWAANGGGRDV